MSRLLVVLAWLAGTLTVMAGGLALVGIWSIYPLCVVVIATAVGVLIWAFREESAAMDVRVEAVLGPRWRQ